MVLGLGFSDGAWLGHLAFMILAIALIAPPMPWMRVGIVLSSIAGQVVQIGDHIHSIASTSKQQSASLNEINDAVARMEKPREAFAPNAANTEMYARDKGLPIITLETLYDAKAHFSR